MEGLYSFRTIVSPSAYQAISSPWRISLGLSHTQTSIKWINGHLKNTVTNKTTYDFGKRKHLLQRPKPNRHRDIFLGSLRIQRRSSFWIKTLPLLLLLRLTSSRRRRRRARTVAGGFLKLFRRRCGGRGRRICTFCTESFRFHTLFRCHWHFSSNLQTVNAINKV